MLNLDKMAAEDAARWAYAELFFGEGAGTRRKLLNAEIMTKIDRLGPDYEEAMHKYYAAQDFAKLATKAAKERSHLDKAAKRGKNIRAIKNGNMRSLSTGVFVVVVGGYYAHQLGYDKWALEKAKVLKAQAEVRYREYKAKGKRAVTNLHVAGTDGDA